MDTYTRFSRIHRASYLLTLKAKILRLYSYYRMNYGRTYCFVLADDTGNRMEMVMEPGHIGRYPGLEYKEGWWVKITLVDVVVDASEWSVTGKMYRLMVNSHTRINVCDPIILSNFHLLKSFEQIHSPETPASVSVDLLGILDSYGGLVEHPEDAGLNTRFFVLSAPMNPKLACVANGSDSERFGTWLSIAESEEDRPIVVLLKFWKIVRRADGATWLESVDGVSNMMFNPDSTAATALRESMPDAAPAVDLMANDQDVGHGGSGV